MIRIFYGDDRVRIQKEVERVLGKDKEVFEGVEINFADLPSIFQGGSLLALQRKILIKDLGENKQVFEEILKYLDSEHEVVIWENKLDKRTSLYKELSKRKIEIKEFKRAEEIDRRKVFEIYRVALVDGKRAVLMVEEIELAQDPYQFLGLIVKQAIDQYEMKRGIKEKRALVELSKVDIAMKTTGIKPWLILKSFLLRLSSL